MKVTYRKCPTGLWSVVENDGDYYLYWQSYGQVPQLMLVCKGKEVFDGMAECCTGMYSMNHPEIMWDDKLAKEINEII
jgi:hypothetical protein